MAPPRPAAAGWVKTGVMAYDRQWVIDVLQRLGYSQEADAAAQELPEEASREEVVSFGDRHGISIDELTSRMGGSP
jgi:hypothetical protein